MGLEERVARALARNFNRYHFDRGDSDVGWEEHNEAARTAIAEVRRPIVDLLLEHEPLAGPYIHDLVRAVNDLLGEAA